MSDFLQAPSSHDRVPADEVRARLGAAYLVREAGAPGTARLRDTPAGAGETPVYVVPHPTRAGRVTLSADPGDAPAARVLARIGAGTRVLML